MQIVIGRLHLIFVLLLAALAAGCGEKPTLANQEAKEERKTASLRQQLEEIQGVAGAAEVPVVRLAPQAISEELSITGELTPLNSVIVKPLMDGRITFLKPVKVGDMVKKDDMIAKIDDRDIEDQIEWQQKQIALSAEKNKLDEQALEQSKKDLEFDRQLMNEGYLNQHEFEKTEMTLKQSQIALNQSKIALEQDQNKLKQALRAREKVPIVAPLSGMVVLPSHLTSEEKTFNLLNEEIMSLEGTLVGTATPIFGIVSQEGFLAQCQANGRDKAKIHEGQEARVTVITHRPVTVRGKVQKISLLQDAKTHAYKIWIALDGMDKTFTSGLFVRANVELAKKADALVVKREWVKERNNRQFVQVVQANMVKDRWVTTGLSQDDMIELLEGVRAGEMILASKDVYAAEQAVHPVEIEPEAGDDERITKITPDEDALPIAVKRGESVRPAVTLMLDEETSPTRSRLSLKIAGPLQMKNIDILVNKNAPVKAPEKVIHEADVQSVLVEIPVKYLKPGQNEVEIRLNTNTAYLNKPIEIRQVELWVE